MEPDTATEAATVAASDARATIVVLEDEQPGPSTFKEEGAAAAATEATTATEKGEKKEVNRKGVCARALCVLDTSCAWPLVGAQTLTFWRRQVPKSPQGWGQQGGRTLQHSLPSPFPAGRLLSGGGAGRGRGRVAGCPNTEPRVSPSLGPPLPSRNWGEPCGGWGCAGKCLRLSLSLLALLPPSSRRPLPGKSGPFSPTIALKGIWLGLIFVI